MVGGDGILEQQEQTAFCLFGFVSSSEQIYKDTHWCSYSVIKIPHTGDKESLDKCGS